MRAVYYEAFGEAPVVASLPDPSPAPDGVVIKVGATGLCRSDWHGWMGHDPDIRLPHVPGHEFAGEIVAVGREVRGFAVGERVTVPFVAGCGRCGECHSGNAQVCERQFQPGFTHWGSFAELVAIDRADFNLVRLPETLGDAAAASLGCRFATSFRAVVDQGRVRGGEWVAVHGCGGVGLSAVMIAAAMGAQVIAVDVSQEALALAREIGAVATVGDNAVEAIREISGGGAHLSLDALGSDETCWNSISCLRRRGRHVQVGLMVGEPPRLPMARVIAHELEILGSHGMQAWRYDAMLAMIGAGTLRPDKLIARETGLDEAPAAFTAMAGRGVTVIRP